MAGSLPLGTLLTGSGLLGIGVLFRLAMRGLYSCG